MCDIVFRNMNQFWFALAMLGYHGGPHLSDRDVPMDPESYLELARGLFQWIDPLLQLREAGRIENVHYNDDPHNWWTEWGGAIASFVGRTGRINLEAFEQLRELADPHEAHRRIAESLR